jgi:hypothetical protein
LEGLKKFPVVCLPNTAILSVREVDLLHRYVKNGGNLVITGQTGQFDAYGVPLKQSSLATLIGARVTRRLESEDNWVSVPSSTKLADDLDSLVADLRPAWPFLVKGPATVYEPTTAQRIGKLYKPHRTQRQLEGRMGTEWPLSPESPVGPAILINEIGKGTVVTCAASPDYATASEHALVEDRILFRNLVQTLLTRRRIQLDAPANVEAVVTDAPTTRQLRVHLLAYNPTPRTTPQKNRPYILPGMIEDTPIFRVTAITQMPIKDRTEQHSSNDRRHSRSSRHELLERLTIARSGIFLEFPSENRPPDRNM